MDLIITRDGSTDHGTPGALTVAGLPFHCDTLELPWRNNERGVSCILPGTYRAVLWDSPTFKRKVLRLEDKHGRQNCLVHNGNFAGEAPGDITQVHGCTLVGVGYGFLQRPASPGKQFAILKSVSTLEALLSAIGPGPHTITYLWKPGGAPADMSDHLAGAKP